MRIGELATSTGVSTKMLRFYERERLLPRPARSPNDYRDYDDTAIARVGFIRQAQAAGFTLAQIRGILDIRDGGEVPCSHVGALIRERLAQIADRITELYAAREVLQQLEHRSGQLDPSDCDGYCHHRRFTARQPNMSPRSQSPPAHGPSANRGNTAVSPRQYTAR